MIKRTELFRITPRWMGARITTINYYLGLSIGVEYEKDNNLSISKLCINIPFISILIRRYL